MLLASFLAFVLSANIAWLNPNPEFEVYRTGPLPVLWQYDADAGVELVSAAWFPEAFRTYPERIGRPTYPALVNGISRVVEWTAGLIRPVTRLEAAGAAYAAFKLGTTLLAGQLAFAVLRRRMSRDQAVLGSVLFILHWHMVQYAAAFHTTDLQLTATVVVAWLALVVAERADRRRDLDASSWHRPVLLETFLAGLAVGVLLLAKQTLVGPLAVLAVLILSGHLLLALIAALGSALPFVGYLIFLRIRDIRYVSWEVEQYGQGRWILEALDDPQLLRTEFIDAALAFPVDTLRFYGPVLLLAIVGMRRAPHTLRKWDARWTLLALVAAFFQYLGVQRKIPYMTADLGIVVFGAAAVGLTSVRDSLRERLGRGPNSESSVAARGLLAFVVVASLVSAVANLINFPWLAPSEQPARDTAVLENRVDILERPEAYSDDARRSARDGRIIQPDLE